MFSDGMNEQDQYLYTKAQMEDMICMALGGRIAEEVCFGKITTGARDDLDRVTKILYAQITKYGMGNIGPISYPRARGEEGMTSSSYSEETAEEIDKEVRLEAERLYGRAKDILIEKKDLLLKLAAELLQKEVLSRSDVAVILGPRPFEISDLALDMYDGISSEEKKTPWVWGRKKRECENMFMWETWGIKQEDNKK